jgi:hypothetical protein
MENKTNIFKRFHTAITTRHVYIKEEQVYLKKEPQDIIDADTSIAEWLPTDFQWQPINS